MWAYSKKRLQVWTEVYRLWMATRMQRVVEFFLKDKNIFGIFFIN